MTSIERLERASNLFAGLRGKPLDKMEQFVFGESFGFYKTDEQFNRLHNAIYDVCKVRPHPRVMHVVNLLSDVAAMRPEDEKGRELYSSILRKLQSLCVGDAAVKNPVFTVERHYGEVQFIPNNRWDERETKEVSDWILRTSNRAEADAITGKKHWRYTMLSDVCSHPTNEVFLNRILRGEERVFISERVAA